MSKEIRILTKNVFLTHVFMTNGSSACTLRMLARV